MHKIILFLVVLAVVARASEIQEGIKNKRIERTIDLTSQFARHSVALEIENKGSKAASIYVFTLEETVAKSLATLEAIDEQTGNLLAVQKEAVSKGSYVSYTVTLAKSLAPQSSAPIRIKFVLSRSMTPFPSVINQDEKQLVRYYDNHFVFTPYPTGTQTTTVKLPTSFIESKSEQAPTSVSGSTITYGPYEDVAPLSRSAMSVHFENNKPFIAAHQVVKEIEVSHWGSNVAIEETYDLEHVGAKLKGTFSRFDYQRTPPGKGSVVPSFKQVLPAGASDVYYRDEIGNISTSHLFEVPTGPVMDVIPRFPLFGGWKIGFYFGYNLPASSYLFTDYNDKSTHVLNVTFASNLNDIAIEELVVRVILPEGSKNIQVHTPFAVDSQTTETHFTYLDTAGRPVLVLTKKNVVPEHNKPFQVVYTYNTSRVLQEPFLLIGAYFFFFVLFMVYSRISIKIGPSTKGDDS